jgi:hypothetical protein
MKKLSWSLQLDSMKSQESLEKWGRKNQVQLFMLIILAISEAKIKRITV